VNAFNLVDSVMCEATITCLIYRCEAADLSVTEIIELRILFADVFASE